MSDGDARADDPLVWLAHARSSLAHAEDDRSDVLREALCFDAQQAAEKALKALLLRRAGAFPYVHDLRELAERLEDTGLVVPDAIRRAGDLTRYAVESRYPGIEPVTESEYQDALEIARAVVRWAGEQLGRNDG